MTRTLDLSFVEPERRLTATLAGPWNDLLYVPGAGFTSPIDPGSYVSTLIVVLAGGPAVRLSSLRVPAFGGDLCRLRLEALPDLRLPMFGSFFEPVRKGRIYAMSGDREAGATRPPDRAEWVYEGESMQDRLGGVKEVRVVRERVAGGEGDGAFSWTADRGIAVTSAGGDTTLILARPDESDAVLLVSPVGLYRPLLDSAAPAIPGAAVRDLLGYADWPDSLRIAVDAERLAR